MPRALFAAALLLLTAPAALARHDEPSVDDRLRDVEVLLDRAVASGRMDALHEARVQVARARADLRAEAAPPAPVMSATAEAALHEQLRRASYDSNRIALLRRLRDGAAFTTADVATLLAEFGGDAGRIEAVKVLRDVVVDPENRVLLLASFDYDSSRVAVLDVWQGVDLTAPTNPPPVACAPRSSRSGPHRTARGS
jgi:hypothetical protein